MESIANTIGLHLETGKNAPATIVEGTKEEDEGKSSPSTRGGRGAAVVMETLPLPQRRSASRTASRTRPGRAISISRSGSQIDSTPRQPARRPTHKSHVGSQANSRPTSTTVEEEGTRSQKNSEAASVSSINSSRPQSTGRRRPLARPSSKNMIIGSTRLPAISPPRAVMASELRGAAESPPSSRPIISSGDDEGSSMTNQPLLKVSSPGFKSLQVAHKHDDDMDVKKRRSTLSGSAQSQSTLSGGTGGYNETGVFLTPEKKSFRIQAGPKTVGGETPSSQTPPQQHGADTQKHNNFYQKQHSPPPKSQHSPL
uniref:Uncharacterized protein n=1 Tax=Heterosigma akashiwo TaxID=2829 RepID=A0A7S3UUB2_HETAK